MTEGLIQGDPAAPAFAQLVYSACCERVRQANPDLQVLASFFDDINLFDVPEVALACARALEPEFLAAGLRINWAKSVALATAPLSPAELAQFAALGLDVVADGIVTLGGPVGTEAFVRAHVASRVEEAMAIVSKVGDADLLGRLHAPWASTQGLFSMMRLSVNHLLRHLLRIVDPTICMDEMARLDEATVRCVGHLFHMSASDLTECRRTRIGLPGSLGGFGITPYCLAARPAFLGLLHRVLPRLLLWLEEPLLDIPSFEVHHSALSAYLTVDGQCLVPDRDSFLFPEYGPFEQGAHPQRHLQKSLTHAVLLKEHRRIVASASEDETFILRVTSPATAGDFLFVPLTSPLYRIPARDFLVCARLYLDLPVCGPACHIGDCHGVAITRDGQHAASHAQRRSKERHDRIVTVIGGLLRHLAASGSSEYECRYEVPLDSFPHLTRKSGAPPTELRCDFVLEHRVTHDLIFADVRVTHPVRSEPAVSARALAASEHHWDLKFQKYMAHYELAAAAVQPLVFEVYGGYAPKTHEFLRTLVLSMARGDDRLFGRLWSDLRNRIAVTLARGQAALIHYFNYRNGGPVLFPPPAHAVTGAVQGGSSAPDGGLASEDMTMLHE
jgi:hypothetical protein